MIHRFRFGFKVSKSSIEIVGFVKRDCDTRPVVFVSALNRRNGGKKRKQRKKRKKLKNEDKFKSCKASEISVSIIRTSKIDNEIQVSVELKVLRRHGS